PDQAGRVQRSGQCNVAGSSAIAGIHNDKKVTAGDKVVHIGVPLETQTGETRVAATPETIKKLVGQGHQVTVQRGAGLQASIPDSAYEAAGASLGSAADAFGAQLVLKVVAPNDQELAQINS